MAMARAASIRAGIAQLEVPVGVGEGRAVATGVGVSTTSGVLIGVAMGIAAPEPLTTTRPSSTATR